MIAGHAHGNRSHLNLKIDFIFPHLQSTRSVESTVAHIRRELRPFVAHGFEQLCLEWVDSQARKGNLPFSLTLPAKTKPRRCLVDVL
ncbi:MAG: hypothetical protein AAF633_06725 [Chloroflexota bacterium]